MCPEVCFCAPLVVKHFCRRRVRTLLKCSGILLKRAGEIVQDLASEHEELQFTRAQHKRAASVELVRSQHREGRRELLYAARPFLLCGLPLRRPPKGQLTHVRRNGRFLLRVVGDPDHGLPFGQDRLIPIWVATQAIRTRRREFSFDSGLQILNELGLARNGNNYRRLVAGFKRVFLSTVVFGTDASTKESTMWECSKVSFFDRVRLWTPNHLGESPDPGQRNYVRLSEAFWAEIASHPIPVDAEVVRALANAPGALDFYMWLRWRAYGCTREQQIPLLGLGGLADQLGSEGYTRERDFRRTLKRFLDTVRSFWPACPAELSVKSDHLTVRPDPGIPTAGGGKGE